MAAFINTNIASLNAQRNLNASQSGLTTALQRLSSGMRINSSKDDAAGLAISSRMTGQINGLDQAARNANDGISLAQTAEGSLSSITDGLQRIRTLALQSANSTNSVSDRASLNAEVQSALAEIGRVASTTQFNGLNLLDGTFNNSQFQVGANANQTISVSVTGATTSLLGSYGGTSIASTATAWDASTNNISINGTQIGASVAGAAAGVSASSAAAKATAINAASATTGVTADGNTTITGVAPKAGQALANGDLTINGISVGSVAAGGNATAQATNVVTAINSVTNTTGVTATADTSTGAITLTAADGRDIAIGASTNSFSAGTKITNATGLSVGSTTPGTAQSDILSLSATVCAGTSMTMNGVTFNFSSTGTSAASAANTVNVFIGATATATSAATASALITAFADALTSSYTSSALGGISVTNASGVATFTDSKIGTVTTTGHILAVASGATLGAVTSTAGADSSGGTCTLTTKGTVTLSSSSQFTLTGNGTGLAAGGMGSLSPALTALSTVAVDTVAHSNTAIAIIDAALSQVNSQRGTLGAVQNRFTSAISNLQSTSENLSAARSRIVDTDFAAETAALTRGQILQQAGTAMLAQANSLPNGVLALLRG
jgi:flagellin